MTSLEALLVHWSCKSCYSIQVPYTNVLVLTIPLLKFGVPFGRAAKRIGETMFIANEHSTSAQVGGGVKASLVSLYEQSCVMSCS
jgi:hypothetical protein